MTPHDLLANFETLAEAPNGVQRLRELVLELAVRGKLVEQDPLDEPSGALVERIRSQSANSGKHKKLGPKGKSYSATPEEGPYEVPTSWVWVRLKDVADYNGRPNLDPSEIGSDVWVLDLEDIEKDSSRILQRLTNATRQSRSTKSSFCKGDVLYGKLRPYLNKVVVADQDGVCTTEIVPIVPAPGLDSGFLRLLLKRPEFLDYVNQLTYGVKMPRLGTSDAEESLHPLPPTKEQCRIVARVDELMALLDRLEAERQERETARTAARDSALAALREAPTLEDVEVAWLRVQERFSELFTKPEDVEPLRQTVLQLAVRGRLLRQLEGSHAASWLLGIVQVERQKLIRSKEIRAAKPLLPVSAQEKAFLPPPGWEWTPFGELFLEVITGPFGSSLHASDYVSGGIPIVNPQNLQAGSIVPTPSTAVSPGTAERLSTFKIKTGDILVARRGEMGRCAVAGPAETGWLCGTGSLILRPASNLSPDFIALFLRCPETTSRLVGESVGTTMSNLNQRILVNLPIALPPYEEQVAIVGAVRDFDRRCKNLEASLRHSNELAATFSAAAIHHLDT